MVKCLDIFYKIQRIPKEKLKRLQSQLKDLDKHFENLYSLAVMVREIDKKYEAINKLIDYVEKEIGGKRTKEWKLKSKCTC